MMPDFGLPPQHLALRDGLLHDRASMLPHPARRFGLRVPDRIQDGQNVRTGDLIDAPGGDVRKNIASQQVSPLYLMCGAPPSGPMHGDGLSRLTGLEVYVTLEPCARCAGSLLWARVRRLIFGARDEKAGAVLSKVSLLSPGLWNHDLEIVEGVLEAPCGQILSQFFAGRRGK